eukprot:6214148-Pleurochrysis_carterae.AAC.2
MISISTKRIAAHVGFEATEFPDQFGEARADAAKAAELRSMRNRVGRTKAQYPSHRTDCIARHFDDQA